MTNEIFVSEKTGKRYRIKPHNLGGYLVDLREIIEPKLERTDWYQYEEDEFACHQNRWSSIEVSRLKEIRKANGEVWQKIEGVWHKK